jgi:hypothetical protein
LSLISRFVRGLVHHRLIIAVVVASGVGVALTSRDLFLTPIAAATMAGIVVVLLQRIWRSGQWSDWKHVRTTQMLSMVAVPVAFSTGLSVNSDHLFRQAFNVDAPAGIHDLTIDANLLNPAGKRTALLRFRADDEAMADLLAKGGFAADPQMQEAWAAGDSWADIVHQAFSDFPRAGGASWNPITPMTRPEFREWRRTAGGTRTGTRVLWDSHTGQAFVLYTVR